MTAVINNKCCRCMNCYNVCPVDAVVDTGDSQLYIDSSLCIDCGKCSRECPKGAITQIDSSDQKWIDLNESNANGEGGHSMRFSSEYDDPDDYTDNYEENDYNEEDLEENW